MSRHEAPAPAPDPREQASSPLSTFRQQVGNRGLQRLALGTLRQPRLQRQALPREDHDLARRRSAARELARRALTRITHALGSGFLWSFETRTVGGITNSMGDVETPTRREARLRGLVADLIGLVQDLEGAPIPQPWLNPTVRVGSDRLTASSRVSPAWTDTARFYAHRSVGRGRSLDEVQINLMYIDMAPATVRRIEPAPVEAATDMSMLIDVFDPDRAPLEYRRVVSGTDPIRGMVFRVFRDAFGYFYTYRSRRHYLPARP